MRRLVWAVAALAGVAWLPFIARPLSPDEGGFLLVASQWHPGPSLYGHYWVDRPPLLLTLFDAAAHLGGATGLRLIGVAAVVLSVLLAAHLGHAAAGRRTLTPAIVAAIFLSSPLLGSTVVDGELLAVPLVLMGIVAIVRSCCAPPRAAAGWSVAAGAAGMAAALVKQNVIDVLVVTGVMVVAVARARGPHPALRLTCGVAAGGAGTLGAMLAVGEARGTEPGRLWDAVIIFRAHAAAVIQSSSTSSTHGRLVGLLEAALISGAPVVVAVLLLRVRGRPSVVVTVRLVPDLRAPALALLTWELAAVAGGGSYWLHYLVGLVPGMVLLAAAACQRVTRLARSTAAALALAGASCVTAVVVVALAPSQHVDDTAVAAFLRAHGTRQDTVVVAFGHPNIVYDSGLRSPYEQLWSLPVRVEDPGLTELGRVLRSPRAPTWVVVSGHSLATWGVDATQAQRILDHRYTPKQTVGTYVVWRRSTAASTPLPTVRSVAGNAPWRPPRSPGRSPTCMVDPCSSALTRPAQALPAPASCWSSTDLGSDTTATTNPR